MGQGPPPMGGMGAGPMNGSGPGMGPGMGSGMEPPDAASIFEAEDTDDSGTISSDESALPEDVFSSLDTDGDGEISMEELEAAISEKQDEMAGFQPTMASLSTTQQDALAAYQQAMETFMTDYTDGQYTGSNLNEFLEIVA
ncbi:MAG: hypothetical protein HUN04_01500 [Desulfobacter sp.]|nr:MAG: hypothetical protein HUN04_01500 [Desulfobacter sp.]